MVQTEGGDWVLPKGKLHRGEHYAHAATREVAEETGLRAGILRPLQSTHYTYLSGGEPIDKTVHWFLMTPKSGTVLVPVERFRQAAWLSLEEAAQRLTWEEDRGLIATVLWLNEEASR